MPRKTILASDVTLPNPDQHSKDATSTPALPEYDCLFKFKLIGDPGIGKSNLLLRFTDNKYTESCQVGDGKWAKLKDVKVASNTIRLQIWDTMGKVNRKHNVSTYERGIHGYIVAFDLTDQVSFNNIKTSFSEIKKEDPDASIILVGTKCDLTKKRVINPEVGHELAKTQGIDYIETSALTGENVDAVFESLSRSIADRRKLNTPPPINTNIDKKLQALITKAEKALAQLPCVPPDTSESDSSLLMAPSPSPGAIINKHFSNILSDLKKDLQDDNSTRRYQQRITIVPGEVKTAFQDLNKTSKGQHLGKNVLASVGAVLLCLTGIGIPITLGLGINNIVKRSNPFRFFNTELDVALQAEQAMQPVAARVSQLK